jgi:hypothetical protein
VGVTKKRRNVLSLPELGAGDGGKRDKPLREDPQVLVADRDLVDGVDEGRRRPAPRRGIAAPKGMACSPMLAAQIRRQRPAPRRGVADPAGMACSPTPASQIRWRRPAPRRGVVDPMGMALSPTPAAQMGRRGMSRLILSPHNALSPNAHNPRPGVKFERPGSPRMCAPGVLHRGNAVSASRCGPTGAAPRTSRRSPRNPRPRPSRKKSRFGE